MTEDRERAEFERAQSEHAMRQVDAGRSWNSASFRAGWEAARCEERKRCAEIIGHDLAADSNECRPLCPACRLEKED